jgi:hypothetical protein
MCREMPAAVLAFVAVAGQDVAAAQVDPLPREPIKAKQPDDARDLDFEVDRPNPIVFGFFQFGTQFAHFSPRIERVGGEFAVFKVNDLGQFAAKQGKRPPHVHHMDGHVEPVEHQDAARQCAAGGVRQRRRVSNAPTPRDMPSGTAHIGCLKALHVPPPMLCPSLYCSRFSRRAPAETDEIGPGVSRGTAAIFLTSRSGHSCRNSVGSACQRPRRRITMMDVGCGVTVCHASARADHQPGAGK